MGDPSSESGGYAANLEGGRNWGRFSQYGSSSWRELRGGETARVYVGNSDQMPPGYHDLVDEYFRKLANES